MQFFIAVIHINAGRVCVILEWNCKTKENQLTDEFVGLSRHCFAWKQAKIGCCLIIEKPFCFVNRPKGRRRKGFSSNRILVQSLTDRTKKVIFQYFV